MKNWSILDDLHFDFVRSPPTPRDVKRALREYKSARAKREKAEEAAKAALVAESRAAEQIVRTQGRQRVYLDRRPHIVSYSKNRVFFIPCQGD